MKGIPPVALIVGPATTGVPSIETWLASAGLSSVAVAGEEELVALALRGRPRLVVIDARPDRGSATGACIRLKSDSCTASLPTILVCGPAGAELEDCFRAGADEVLHSAMGGDEIALRLESALRRSDRDLEVHPSTRLPGTVAIEAELARRLTAGDTFAMCYADLDHFKEYNDRYSYHDGDRVIRVLARILHDVVKGMCGDLGFVGHIGGDDFIFLIPAADVADVCSEVLTVFDALLPYQYSEPDQRAGYFFGKDRRGNLHRVPLMTLSIGVVTNERRAFTSPAQISELATEMKGYAKTLPGSVFAIDRRQEHLTSAEATPVRPHQALIIGAER